MISKTYVTAPCLADWQRGPDAENYLARTVHVVDDEAPRFSGLLNASGEKLYREVKRPRIGFVRFGDSDNG